MMTIRFYHDPLITRDHRIIREGREPIGFLFSETVPDFEPVWWGSMTLDFPRRPYAKTSNRSAPNYAEVLPSASSGAYLRYFVDVRPATTETVSMTFSVDWWGTYGADLTIAAGRRSLGRSGYFVTSAKFANDPVVYYHPIGTANWADGDEEPVSQRWCLVQTVQVYQNNTFPLPDGKPTQVTLISKTAFSSADINGTGTKSTAFFDLMSIKKVGVPLGSGQVIFNFDVIAVLSRQLIPYDMIHGVGDDDFFDVSAGTVADWVQAVGDYDGNVSVPCAVSGAMTGDAWGAFASGGHFKRRIRRYPIVSRTDSRPQNTAERRLFVGNLHTRIPLDDQLITQAMAPQQLAAVYITLTFNEGFSLELEVGDKLVDITAIFDAGVAFNNEQDMKYQAGDAKALGAISSGVASVGQIAAGAGLLAAGNPLGLLTIAGGATSAAGIANSLQYRSRETVTGGATTAISDAINGILFGLIEVLTDNPAERWAYYGKAMHGENAEGKTITIEDSALTDIVEEEMTPYLPSVPVQISDVVLVVKDQTDPMPGGSGGWMIPTPNVDLIMEAEADLARGLTVVRHDVTTFSVAT